MHSVLNIEDISSTSTWTGSREIHSLPANCQLLIGSGSRNRVTTFVETESYVSENRQVSEFFPELGTPRN